MKRSVNLDCYRASRFHHAMSLGQILNHIGQIGGVQGIDASSEALVADYPIVTDSFLTQWQELLEIHKLTPVTLGTYIDRLQFRNHIMSVEETADALRRDLKIAKVLGFQNMRIMHDIPLASVELALPLAEELNIRMLDELLPPGTIRPRAGRKGEDCRLALDMIARTGTKHFGLMMNLGLFQSQPNPTQIFDVLLEYLPVDEVNKHYESIMEHFRGMEFPAFEEWINKNYPKLNTNRELFQRMFGVRLFGHSVELSDLQLLNGNLFDIYAKFTKMIPSSSNVCGWDEPAIPYGDVIAALENCGYDGFVCSMRMSAPTLSLGKNRTACEIAAEECTDVERHQAMLRQWIP